MAQVGSLNTVLQMYSRYILLLLSKILLLLTCSPKPSSEDKELFFFSENLKKDHAFLLILLRQGVGHIAEEGRDTSFLCRCNICLLDYLFRKFKSWI